MAEEQLDCGDEAIPALADDELSKHLQDNVQGVKQASTTPDGAKKVPSRSARRKKAKRQWNQKLAKISHKMEGFVLPPSESTRILKDKEVLCVKREEMNLTEEIEEEDSGNLVDYAKVNRKESVNNGMQKSTEPLPVETVFTKIKSSKKKKHHLEVVVSGGEGEVVRDQICSICKKKIKLNDEISDEKIKSPPNEKRSEHLQENVQGVEQASTAPIGAKKGPSRSTIRKKLKRQWKKENAKISQKMEGFVIPPSESTRILKDMKVLCVKLEDESSHLEIVSKKRKASKIEHLQENEQGVKQTSTTPDGAKKVPSRSARRIKAKRQWNRKLAKISQKSNKEANGHLKGLVVDFVDFSKLPLCISPKEGDVIAYRVVELSSSCTPELSSYRVGKISDFDGNKIVLNPIPEYPLVLNKMDEDDGPDNNSLYKEDGTLEIKFAGLVDVRSVHQSNSDTVKTVSQTPQGDEKLKFSKNPSLELLPLRLLLSGCTGSFLC